MNIITWCIQISFVLDKTTTQLWFQCILSLCHGFLNIPTSSKACGQRSWSQPFRWLSSPPNNLTYHFSTHQNKQLLMPKQKSGQPCRIHPNKNELMTFYAWPKKLDMFFFIKYQAYHTIHGTDIFTCIWLFVMVKYMLSMQVNISSNHLYELILLEAKNMPVKTSGWRFTRFEKP